MYYLSSPTSLTSTCFKKRSVAPSLTAPTLSNSSGKVIMMMIIVMVIIVMVIMMVMMIIIMMMIVMVIMMMMMMIIVMVMMLIVLFDIDFLIIVSDFRWQNYQNLLINLYMVSYCS